MIASPTADNSIAMEYLKKRTLHLTQALAAQQASAIQQQLIQSIQNVIECKFSNRYLTIKYDLQKTSLQTISPQIQNILANYKCTLGNSMIDKIRTSFIYFTETNQQDNLHVFSGWHLRLQQAHTLAAADKANDSEN